jgi:peptidoglycan/xylan/chitin deacetylase (PgdA/CDA1 family)
MLRLLARLLPIAALGVGSWIGLGKPAVETLRADCAPYLRWGIAEAPASPHLTERESPPVPSVDTTLLPDPNPWPALNDDASVTRAWLLAEGPLPTPGNGRRVVTLTFDDGPFPETTPVVLTVLEKHHVHATFFWIGRYLDGNSERAVRTRKVALEVCAAGHLIGTHTHDHERLIGISHAEVLAQIDRGMSSIERAVGVRPSVFRPPFGQLDAYGGKLAHERGLTLVLWNVETQDLHHTDADAASRRPRPSTSCSRGSTSTVTTRRTPRWSATTSSTSPSSHGRPQPHRSRSSTAPPWKKPAPQRGGSSTPKLACAR